LKGGGQEIAMMVGHWQNFNNYNSGEFGNEPLCGFLLYFKAR